MMIQEVHRGNECSEGHRREPKSAFLFRYSLPLPRLISYSLDISLAKEMPRHIVVALLSN